MRLAINLGNGKRYGAAWIAALTFATTGCVALEDTASTIDMAQVQKNTPLTALLIRELVS